MYYLVYSCVYLSCCVHQLVDMYIRRDHIKVVDSYRQDGTRSVALGVGLLTSSDTHDVVCMYSTTEFC